MMTKTLKNMIKNFNTSTKKWFILAAIGVVTLASCTKIEDTAPPRKITFEKAIYRPQTKADGDTISVLGEFHEFKCKAFLHATNGQDGYFETQNFFGESGETIKPYTTGDVLWTSGPVTYWAPSHDYYWPKAKDSYINFVAWYDAKVTPPNEATERSLKWENYTVVSTDNLLFADEAWRYKETPDATYAKDGVTKGVPMLFHHALAKLCIKANVTQTEKNNVTGGASLGKTIWEVTLSDISLGGVYSTGTLTLSNGDPADDSPAVNTSSTKAWSGAWESSGSKGSYPMADKDSALTTDAVYLLEMRTVLPQAVTPDMVLSFDYLIKTKFVPAGQEASTITEYAKEKIHADVKLSDFSGHISEWEMNKKITYTVTIDPETELIKIDPAMVDWIGEEGGSATIN